MLAGKEPTYLGGYPVLNISVINTIIGLYYETMKLFSNVIKTLHCKIVRLWLPVSNVYQQG
jgi:hypothetical protein